jgi:hypothetical protein
VITLQIADPSSRQRVRPTETRPQISDSNTPTGSNIWSQVLQGCSIPRHTDRLTVSRKVTSTFDLGKGQILLTATDKRQTRSLVREVSDAPHREKRATFRQN